MEAEREQLEPKRKVEEKATITTRSGRTTSRRQPSEENEGDRATLWTRTSRDQTLRDQNKSQDDIPQDLKGCSLRQQQEKDYAIPPPPLNVTGFQRPPGREESWGKR